MVHLSMGVSDMKRYLINIAIFFAIVAVVDFALGKAFHYLQANVAGGRTGAEYFVCKQSSDEVIVMGSSRASHHYVPEIISENLGLSCFNAGQDGNGIILQYGRWKMISNRYTPKLIIYDVEPFFDLYENDNTRYIDRLKPFASDKNVHRYITELYTLERYKLLSQLYRYNFKFLEISYDCIRSVSYKNGYDPLYGHIRQEMINGSNADNSEKREKVYDDVKIATLRNLITEAQASDVKVVLVSSPYWKTYGTPDMRIVRQIADEFGVPFFDYSNSYISNNPDYFEDSMHLNDNGARVFTNDLTQKLKALLGV